MYTKVTGMPTSSWRRDLSSDASSVKTTFSSWDNCMDKAYCKSVILSLRRHQRVASPPPTYPNNTPYQSAPPPTYSQPAQYGPPVPTKNVPQVAVFDTPTKSAKINEDALPHMPSWDQATSRRVEEVVESAEPEKPGDVEMSRLDTNGQSTGRSTPRTPGMASPMLANRSGTPMRSPGGPMRSPMPNPSRSPGPDGFPFPNVQPQQPSPAFMGAGGVGSGPYHGSYRGAPSPGPQGAYRARGSPGPQQMGMRGSPGPQQMGTRGSPGPQQMGYGGMAPPRPQQNYRGTPSPGPQGGYRGVTASAPAPYRTPAASFYGNDGYGQDNYAQDPYNHQDAYVNDPYGTTQDHYAPGYASNGPPGSASHATGYAPSGSTRNEPNVSTAQKPYGSGLGQAQSHSPVQMPVPSVSPVPAFGSAYAKAASPAPAYGTAYSKPPSPVQESSVSPVQPYGSAYSKPASPAPEQSLPQVPGYGAAYTKTASPVQEHSVLPVQPYGSAYTTAAATPVHEHSASPVQPYGAAYARAASPAQPQPQAPVQQAQWVEHGSSGYAAPGGWRDA
ncbi:hypothetical protein K490DRAFT_69722 [Saccharata proteae CBS 121410]|uniref:Uncharacterized protein n=1 Tax=Saccharata proteae CBS 121410 TaxID=1314787 RepID=A0A9P4HNI1_9PEZI|nr:hypothetical protein K490DRAFT_69722 [Saccharata proteae CBS 121410]